MLLPISKSLLAANIILPTLALLAVSFRIAARRKKHLPLGGDDYAILVALVSCSPPSWLMELADTRSFWRLECALPEL